MLYTARRAQAVRQALADYASALPLTTDQLALLTRFVLGQLTRRQLHRQLDRCGPALLRLPRQRWAKPGG